MTSLEKKQESDVLFDRDGNHTTLHNKLADSIAELFRQYRGISTADFTTVVETVCADVEMGDVELGQFQGTERSLPLDIYTYISVVPLDWVTLPEAYKPYVQELREIFMFDRNLHIHICSTTPSVEIHRISQDVVLHDHDAVSDELKEEIYTWWDDACAQDNHVDYTDAGPIEKMIKSGSERVKRYGTPVGTDGETFDELWESCLEDIRGNCRWE